MCSSDQLNPQARSERSSMDVMDEHTPAAAITQAPSYNDAISSIEQPAMPRDAGVRKVSDL
jgi:hypothetical protein